jgi:hypothetical protein
VTEVLTVPPPETQPQPECRHGERDRAAVALLAAANG